jgi:hypothetical protein
MKAAAPKKSASPTAAASRPFFQTKPEHGSHDSAMAVAEQAPFFRPLHAGSAAGALPIQAKFSGSETEAPERQGEADTSESVQVRRTPAFESGEDAREASVPVQRKPTSANPFFAAPGSDGADPGTAKPFFASVQPKLAIGQIGDRYEREADAAAADVVSGRQTPAISSLPPGGLRRSPGTGAESTVPDSKASDAIENKGPGEPLQPIVQRELETGLGHDLSDVRVHDDSAAQDTAQSLNARAFTHGSDIWLGPGESQQDTRLMAHEATHVVQQTGPSDAVQRAPATPAGDPGDVAPGVIELKDQAEFKPSDKIGDWLEQRKRKRGKVRLRFGTLAEGTVEMRKVRDDYAFDRKALPLKHPAIRGAGENLPAGFMPSLIVSKKPKGKVAGFVSLRAAAKSPSQGFDSLLKQAPEVMGLAGFDLSELPNITNKLDSGKLHLGISGGPIRLGGAFTITNFKFALVNEAVTFAAGADVSVKGLGTGNLTLKRDEKGLITGKVAVALQLPKNFSGSVDVAWDGRAITGMGKVGYQGEKLSGEVTLQLMEKGKALALEQTKKAPPPAEGAAAGGGAAKPPAKKKSGKVDYVVFGEGDLTFAFTDWLNGTAHVIVDPKGFVTIIGKITPQKEFELFPQKDYNKKLFKIEARASYGIPVVGNLFIFANIGLGAFAKLGPAKFYKIEVAGTYSTDPNKNKDFSIKGSLNVSAAAGLKLRGEVGAGIEILGHDLKAGGGVDATAGIKGYAEATPVIGYREKGAPGEDKKGEFFIRGDLEIAAQPFFGLSGDLFLEVDSPWWSPLPDKRWTWPLGSKEWPLGRSFGFGASIDYVFGSGKPPEITFPPVEFSADKFTSDMLNDKSKPKTPKEPKEGKWKEKNSKTAEPPAKTGGPGAGVALGKAKPPAPGKPPTSKEKKNPPTPGARTADGKTVKELKDAARKGKKETTQEPKGTATPPTTAKSKVEKPDAQKEQEKKWARGVSAVKKALAYAEREGIGEADLNRILKSIRKQKQFGFKELSAKGAGEYWLIHGSMSPGKEVTQVKKKSLAKAEEELRQKFPKQKLIYPIHSTLGRAKGPFGNIERAGGGSSREFTGKRAWLS